MIKIHPGTRWTLSIFGKSEKTGLNCKIDVGGINPEVELRDDFDFCAMLLDFGKEMAAQELVSVADDWRLMTEQEIQEYLEDDS